LMALPALRSLSVAAAVVAVSVLLRFTWLAPETRSDLPLNQLRSSVEDFVDRREVQNLSFALDAYRLVKGTYPSRLDGLVSAGLLGDDQIRNRYGDTYAYMHIPSEARYVLSP
jgi:hypothetical protein